MNQAGRGCHPEPPPSGDAGSFLPASASPLVDQLIGDVIPAVMQSADWRALASLVSGTAPAIVHQPEPVVVLESDESRLTIEPAIFVLPELTSSPFAQPPVEANATWG
jgi:hypothetical protein